ncbi:prolyl oligopeptidase family protein [Novosphingobium sp. FSW06-99]|uniref:prolyl oligopeptidase family serine peptidase n=1 Tax=Novosphingobium sp. FSW06-99 TaxID=1739113 RepID=UPI001E38F160|nr:prolyl oligopeptidase family serine peptidase [Novosphingobium sp. FSW06-99]
MMQWDRIRLRRALPGIAMGFAAWAAPVSAKTDAVGIDAAEIAAPRAPAPTTQTTLPTLVHYPMARRDSVSDHVFGEVVADPWRWLEADIRTDHAVADWVGQENAMARTYLAALPGHDRFAQSLRELYDYERYSLPKKAGHRYFFLRNSGLLNQSVLYVRDGLDAPDRVLVDPNRGAGDAYALDAWVPSHSGRYLAVGEQREGSDWRTIRVIDAASGARLTDRLEWANDTLIGWVGDQGFLYSRYPAPRGDDAYRAPLHDKAIWYHRIGTGQDADVLVYATPDHPDWGHKAQVTSDGRWAVITTEPSTAPLRAIHLIDLAAVRRSGTWAVLPLVDQPTHDWKLVDGEGDRLWFITNDGAPNYRLVRIDFGARPGAHVVVSGGRGLLEAGRIVGDRLILSYLDAGQRLAVVTDLNGRPARAITISANGAASGFDGRPGDFETFYQYSSYNQPPAIYRMDMRRGTVAPFARPAVPFNPADYVIENRQYPSRDGTMVPLTVVRKRTLAASGMSAPTLLYGYGGFDIALNPGYSPWRMAWLEAGGVFAVAAVRGGGELGPAWYQAGRAGHKQNSFDDFIAAGDYLIKSGIARSGSLAAQGGSNGGMMVAAVINQRPDLFVAANPDVGVMDMLRFDRFTQGRSWIDDYGDPARAADWHTLRAYSPYHNIRDGERYPAILVTTADTDDRVVPAHSFKYVAALQAAQIGDRPHLLRVESDAGHGTGKPLDKAIASGADVLAFLAAWTGLPAPSP